MKLMIRNLLYLFKRFKTAVVLNLFGLTIAFAAFLLIVMQVDYEMNYDAMHSKSGRTFRLEANHGEFEHNAIHCLMFSDAFVNSSAHITDYSYRYPFYGGERYCQIDEVDDQGEAKVFKENFQLCLPNISDVFDFHMKEGSVECLSIPGSVLIPESVAKRLFDKQSAIGKRIRMSGSSGWQPVSTTILTIGGVYKDFPGNTTVQNRIYVPMDQLDLLKSSWQMYANEIYVTLDDPLNKEEVLDHFNKTFDFAKSQMGSAQEIALRLTPLKDVYYTHDTTFDFNPKGHRETNYVLLGIAFLILFIAGINFTNLTTSLIPLRLKTINTHRVLGCSIYKLRAISLIESIVICLISYILALFIVNDLSYTPIANWVDADIRLSQYKALILLTALIAILTGCLAGLYPAIRSTSYAPALVLKGSFGLSPKGKKVRVALIGFQYTVSIALIIVTLFMGLQNHFMTSSEQLGFNKDQVAIVNLTPEIYAKHKPQYIQKLKDYPGIEDVAFCSHKFGSEDSYRTWGGVYKEQSVNFTSLSVSWNFFKVMGIPLIGGRMPTESDERGNNYSYVFNRQMRDKWNMEPNDIMRIPWLEEESADGSVIGFVDDVKFTSLRQSVSELGFVINEPRLMLYSFIRVKAGSDIMGVVDHIRKTVAHLDPTYPCEVEFYDEIFDHLYHQERNLSTMILLFSLLAVIISIVGIFGLVIFETQYRRKEIGIRKVFGATVHEILVMFNKIYFRIVCVCFIIAAPLAYYGVRKWLEGFAYKTPIYWWIFAFALLIVSLITMFTVTFQNWRAANANPVDSIKTE